MPKITQPANPALILGLTTNRAADSNIFFLLLLPLANVFLFLTNFLPPFLIYCVVKGSVYQQHKTKKPPSFVSKQRSGVQKCKAWFLLRGIGILCITDTVAYQRKNPIFIILPSDYDFISWAYFLGLSNVSKILVTW